MQHYGIRQARTKRLCLISRVTLLAKERFKNLDTSGFELFWTSIYSAEQPLPFFYTEYAEPHGSKHIWDENKIVMMDADGGTFLQL